MNDDQTATAADIGETIRDVARRRRELDTSADELTVETVDAIGAARADGWTLQQIADVLELSVQRVHQLAKGSNHAEEEHADHRRRRRRSGTADTADA